VTGEAVQKIDRINQFLRQPTHDPVPFAETLAQLQDLAS
jgi:hypothetical protein